MSNVDISGLDKAEVLLALVNSAKMRGRGFAGSFSQMIPSLLPPMDIAFTREIMLAAERRVACGEKPRHAFYFDYIEGLPIKVDLSGDSFNPRLYDRDNGEGAAERAIAKLHREPMSLDGFRPLGSEMPKA